jgi:hypothetical protein
MLSNYSLNNPTDNFSTSKEKWIQPSIDQSPLLVLNEKIIDGIYAATVEEEIVIFADPSQAWFWTKEWQALESEADNDIAEGRFTSHSSMDDFIADLND